MGIYDRDWWRERYNQRTNHDEKKDAEWRQPVPKAERRSTSLRPSPVGAILVWLALFLAVFIGVKSILRM